MSFKIGQIEIGLDKPFFVIAGPCATEDCELLQHIANHLVGVCERTGVPIIFKASFDKANRSSIHSFRGIGKYSGLNILKEIRETFGLPVLTDVHECAQAEIAGRFVDALQVPAFLCRQTDLLIACAKTGLPVNIKKGQFMSPMEMNLVVEKVLSQKNEKIMLTERGTFFGYHHLVNDMLAIKRMQFLGYPVIFDATHSIQTPGLDLRHSIDYKMNALILAKAAVAAGANGLYLEVHPEPAASKSDCGTIMPMDWVEDLLNTCKKIREVIKDETI